MMDPRVEQRTAEYLEALGLDAAHARECAELDREIERLQYARARLEEREPNRVVLKRAEKALLRAIAGVPDPEETPLTTGLG